MWKRIDSFGYEVTHRPFTIRLTTLGGKKEGLLEGAFLVVGALFAYAVAKPSAIMFSCAF